VPSALVDELKRTWGCAVFGHYGTTEMGLGGGVECEAFSGYHLREADLLFEIVDPASGRALPKGQTGEIVFTTLTRGAMPLVRYRTGDLSRFVPEPCPCGTVLPRLAKVRGKIDDMVALGNGAWLGIADLDEVLFSMPEIVNYAASLTRKGTADRFGLEIYPGSHADRPSDGRIVEALMQVPAISFAAGNGTLLLDPIRVANKDWITTGATKRAIVVRREED
jgi:phenylacetate-CoA ligase